MNRIVSALFCLALAVAPAIAQDAVTPDTRSLIQIDDVYRFYKLYDAAGGHLTADVLQHDYIDNGSEGLRELEKIRNTTGARIADAIAKRPEIYADARRCMDILPRVRTRTVAALDKFRALYPEMKFRPITIVVGRGRPVGVTDTRDGYIVIGLEALCASDFMNPDPEERFVHVLVHEYVHLQQPSAADDDPHPSVLKAALVEGSAEFVADLVTGFVGSKQWPAWTKGRETEIESQFVPDEDKTDISKWFYNTTDMNTGMAKPDWMGDLGYWVGERIITSYYERASDKRAALRTILQLDDPHAILAASGWYPGIVLQ